MTTWSLGFIRDDGDFQILATLNNNDGLISDTDFDNMRYAIQTELSHYLDRDITCLNREDTPDYVMLDEDL
jgi:hypothetical protein